MSEEEVDDYIQVGQLYARRLEKKTQKPAAKFPEHEKTGGRSAQPEIKFTSTPTPTSTPTSVFLSLSVYVYS